MNNAIRFAVLPILMLAACAPIHSSIESVNAAPSPRVSPSNGAWLGGSTPQLLPAGQRVITRSASYTIIVKDPERAMADLQQAVEREGGYVTSASSWSGEDSSAYSSLNARVPPDAFPALREAVTRIADKIQNQSFYVSDVTSDYRKLQQRYQELTLAQDQTLRLLTLSSDQRMDSTYRIMRELLDNEMKNVEYQLDSYQQQAGMGTFDVTLNQPAAAPIVIE